MKYTENDAMRYLCVKMKAGRYVQYRNPCPWEQYSLVALRRLVERMNGARKNADYWTEMEHAKKLSGHLKDNEIRFSFSSPENVKYCEMIDRKSVFKMLALFISFEKGSLRVATDTDHEGVLLRYALPILCDLVDIDSECIVEANAKNQDRLSDLIRSKKNFAIPVDLLEIQDCLRYCDICGYKFIGNGVVPEPYRVDTVLPSDVTHSLYSMSLVMEKKSITVKKRNPMTGAVQLKQIHRLMYARGVSWEELLPPTNGNLIDIQIRKKEMDKKCQRYPHRSFCVLEHVLYCWETGSSKVINSLADEIRDILEMVVGERMDWPLCGKELWGILKNEKRGWIGLLELAGDQWIVVGKMEL